MGVQQLLAEHIGNDHNLILWNRNPDLFIDGYLNDNVKEQFSTNSAKPSDLKHIDLVVFAGTPEWLGGPVRAVMDYLYHNPDIPCLFIGVGSGRPLSMLTANDRQVLQRDNCLIISRSMDLDTELNQLLGAEKVVTLPCPALFVANNFEGTQQQKDVTKKALIIQIDKDLNHSISTKLVEEFSNTLSHREDIDIFTFYINEHTYLAEQSIASKYSYEPNDYLRWRTDRVYEMILIQKEIIQPNHDQNKDTYFTWQKYKNGKYMNVQPTDSTIISNTTRLISIDITATRATTPPWASPSAVWLRISK